MKGSAIFNGSQFDAGRPIFERFLAGVILLLSFVGAIVVVAGGWTNIPVGLNVGSFFGGLTLQGICTAVQWFYRKNKWTVQYQLFLQVDACTTTIAYYAVIEGPVRAFAGFVLGAVAMVLGWSVIPASAALVVEALTWVVTYGIALLGALIPEDRLID
jgi:hypothetical protein